MSFSSLQKEQIVKAFYKSSCCKRALLSGILFAKGEFADGQILLSANKQSTADFIGRLVYEVYKKEVSFFREETGGRRIRISFYSNSAEKYILNLNNTDNLFTQKCQNCRVNFLKGVFLSSGRATDPEKAYGIEFSTVGGRFKLFTELLSSLGIVSGVRTDEKGSVFIKSNASVEEFFANAGMNSAMFAVIEARFNGETKRAIQRLINCDTNNITKTVKAAGEQLEIIEALDKADLLSSLPEELEATARLRLEHPDLSLSQLSAISVPKVSKPGLSHRLKKIIEIGNSLLHKEEV